MKAEETTKQGIDTKLNSGMGDFVKMEYLENCLKLDLNFDVRGFVYEKLAGIYASKGMFAEAAKNMGFAADVSITYREKMDFFMKETELFIKAIHFAEADKAFDKALTCGNSQEKMELKQELRAILRKQGQQYEQENRLSKALKIYEKLLSLIEASENQLEVKEKLLFLYEKLGKMNEYNALKRGVE